MKVMKKVVDVGKLKFVATISTMGKNNKIIWIPKQFHKAAEEFEGKQIRVMIDDEI